MWLGSRCDAGHVAQPLSRSHPTGACLGFSSTCPFTFLHPSKGHAHLLSRSGPVTFGVLKESSHKWAVCS